VVVDELALLRAGVAAVARAHGVEVTAETLAVRDAVELARLEAPDLVVLGAAADLPPADAARRLRSLRPAPTLVVLLPTGYDDHTGYLAALGARALVRRTAAAEELGAAIDAALKGETHVSPALHGALAGRLRPREPADTAGLSAREREVLAFLAEGRTNREIAAALSVSVATVKSHLVHIYAKLGAGNRNEALGKALGLGLLA
jgi:DNA-binding NarL/FixJ family response regulator